MKKKERPKNIWHKFKGMSSDHSGIKEFAARNPEQWKKMKKKFDLGRMIADCQFNNGLDIDNENLLRYFLLEFSNRFLQYGPDSLPSSFSIIEAFFNFNTKNMLFELCDEEEAYGISLFDFLDYTTSDQFNSDEIDFVNNIEKNLIYHISFTSGVKDLSFKTEAGKEFLIGHISLIRREQEVVVLLSSGEIVDEIEVQKSLENIAKQTQNLELSSRKKGLGMKLNTKDKTDFVKYLNREDLWHTIAAARFDVENNTIDQKYLARNYSNMFVGFTDQISVMLNEKGELSDSSKDTYLDSIEHLDKSSSLFEFTKMCMYLPYYIEQNENKFIQVEYSTKLNNLIKGPVTKRKYSKVDGKYKLFSRPVFYMNSENLIIEDGKTIKDEKFKIEKSGYWKKIEFNKQGLDKKGRPISGRTWVERNDFFYEQKIGPTQINTIKKLSGPKSGYIYISRQPTFPPDVFKIGLTKRDPEIRSKELSNTSVPDNFFNLVVFPTKDCLQAEKKIHEVLKEYRVSKRREFFKVDIQYAFRVCQDIVEKIDAN